MSRVITISREFGSGGRELALRLANILGIAYYDNEILEQIAQRTPFTAEYIKKVERDLPQNMFSLTLGKSFMYFENQNVKQSEEIFQLPF